MDNFRIDLTSRDKAALLKAVEIVLLSRGPGTKIESYAIKKLVSEPYNALPDSLDGKTALVFRWGKSDKYSSSDVVDLPFKLDATGAVDFTERWLAEADYGKPFDHDGDNVKGWRFFVGQNGRVNGDVYSLFAVLPNWACLGK